MDAACMWRRYVKQLDTIRNTQLFMDMSLSTYNPKVADVLSWLDVVSAIDVKNVPEKNKKNV